MRAASKAALAAAAALLASCTTSRAGLAQFEATLAAQDSATVGLSRWCTSKRLAPSPDIRAEQVAGPAARPPRDLHDLLGLKGDAAPGYRHVRLSCGGVTLSEAHNWYLPARLSAQMNHALATTDTPFGKVAAATGFVRQRLDSKRGAMPSCPAGTILSHRALLRLPDGAPLALVIECYSAANLG